MMNKYPNIYNDKIYKVAIRYPKICTQVGGSEEDIPLAMNIGHGDLAVVGAIPPSNDVFACWDQLYLK